MSKCRKVKYRTRLDAKMALARTQQDTSSRREEIRVYWCQECKGLHLTSQKRLR